jgi:DNA-binding NtrC family response regulator
VKSEPGKGSSFFIYLPQHSEHLEPTEDTSHKLKKGKGSILFVDDEKEITFMGKRMLESLGYSVDIKTNAKNAFQDFKKDPDRYDLLVTDQAMPGMTGIELIGEIQRIRPNMKFIIITGYRDSIPEHSLEQFEIENIISKPLILSEFSELIGTVLRQDNKKGS